MPSFFLYSMYMKLSLFFDSVEESLSAMKADDNSVVSHLSFYKGNSIVWKDFDVVIIGVNEFRGLGSSNRSNSTYAVREKLYKLRSQFEGLNILDLGNLRLGEELQDTKDRLREVLTELIDSHVVPIIIGGGQDLLIAQYLSYEPKKALINWTNIDNKIDVEGEFDASNVVTSVLECKPTHLYNYLHLAHQAYLVNPKVSELFEKLHFDGLRLGELKTDISEAEPLLRSSDMVTFDFNSINPSDLMYGNPEIPFGLSPQEACQLSWYSGLGEQVSSFGLYNYEVEHDEKGLGAGLLATMVWYFIEGLKLRDRNIDFKSSQYVKYVVPITDMDGSITFYKNNISGKWWILIGADNIIPCSYNDYEKANRGDIPDRWLKASNRV